MAINDIVQTIAEARIDARSLSEFVFKPAGFKVTRRLAPTVDTLQFYINRFNSLNGDFSSSVSVALSSLNDSVAEADGKVANKSNEAITSINAAVKSVNNSYNSSQELLSNVSNKYNEAIDTVNRIEPTVIGLVNDAINNTAVEGGVLADTFVVVDATLNQRQINRGFESIADMLSIANPNNGLRVYVKSYHAGFGKGGGYFIYDSAKSAENNGGTVINGWVRDYTDLNNVQHFGAIGSGDVDDSVAIQRALDHSNNTFDSGTYIPFRTEKYMLNNPLVMINPHVLVGNKLPSYMVRDLPGINIDDATNSRAASLVMANNVETGIDLGNGQPSGVFNPTSLRTSGTDQWTVKNISILPETRGVRDQTGLLINVATNGPDRGVYFEGVSIRDMHSAIRVADWDNQTHVASLNLENSIITGCTHAIRAEGTVYGARIVGNQLENNWGVGQSDPSGCIYGAFKGPLLIQDNMLEAQPNVIRVTGHPREGSGCYMRVFNNYFEANNGDFLIKFDNTGLSSLEMHDNFFSGTTLQKDGITPTADNIRFPRDFILIEGTTMSKIDIQDGISVTLKNSCAIYPNHNLKGYLAYLNKDCSYAVYTKYSQVSIKYSPIINLDYLPSDKVSTPLGEMYYISKKTILTGVQAEKGAYYKLDMVLYTKNQNNVDNISLVGYSVGVYKSGVPVRKITDIEGVTTLSYIFQIPEDTLDSQLDKIKANFISSGGGSVPIIEDTFYILAASCKKISDEDQKIVSMVESPPLIRVTDAFPQSLVIIPSPGRNPVTIESGAAHYFYKKVVGVTSLDSGYVTDFVAINSVNPPDLTWDLECSEDEVLIKVFNNSTESVSMVSGDAINFRIKQRGI